MVSDVTLLNHICMRTVYWYHYIILSNYSTTWFGT